jgi:cytochrome c biogenesis protein CcdA
MILIGMTLTGLLGFSMPSVGGELPKKLVERMGFWSALPLGMLFALAFCPATAAMFLGMLTLALKTESRFLFPILYGICSALPIVIVACLIAYQARFLSKIMNAVQNVDVWMRSIVGCLLIALGLYLTIRHNLSW